LIIVVVCLIHAAIYAGGGNFQVWSHFFLAFIPSRLNAAAQIAQYPLIKYTSFVTYGLLHADAMHLMSNVIWLLIFGTPVARRLSWPKFMLVAAAGSFGGALAMFLQYLWEPRFMILVGASATVSALMAAATPIMFGRGSVFARTNSEVAARSAPVLPLMMLLRNREAIIFIAVFLGLQLLTGASQVIDGAALLEQRNIAWESHLGGFIAGLLAFYAVDVSPVPEMEKP
jgi:membrane associated rhomboid family serine protease